jgi:hypothetical protein
MKFEIVIKQGMVEVAKIQGIVNVPPRYVSVEELQRLPEIEGLLERLTGHRFHIQEMC